jgi:hypothetical protein
MPVYMNFYVVAISSFFEFCSTQHIVRQYFSNTRKWNLSSKICDMFPLFIFIRLPTNWTRKADENQINRNND